MTAVADTYWQMPPNQGRALMIAQKEVSVFVYDAVRLEGLNFTLPEIQTLLQGITVGGHKLSDQQIAINQSETWKALFQRIRERQFPKSVPQACMPSLQKRRRWNGGAFVQDLCS